VINWIKRHADIAWGSGFPLLTRQVLDNLLAMPEYHRFLRGRLHGLVLISHLPFVPAHRIAENQIFAEKDAEAGF
jgi:hypothetical protein